MELHRNAKLGLSGRFALVQARERGLSVREVARRLQRLAGDGQPLVAAAGARRASRSGARWAAVRSFESPEADAALVAAARAAADLCRAAADRLGAAAAHRPHRPSALDDLEGAGAQRALAAAAAGARAGAPLRVALSGRPAAHGRRRLYARFERPGHALTGDRTRTAAEKTSEGRLRLRTRDRRRPLAARLCRAPRRRAGSTVTAFVERALACLRRARDRAKRLMTDNAWSYTKNRSLRELLQRARHPPPDHPSAPAAHQRQGRALPPNDGQGVGLRPPSTAPPHTAPRRCHTGSATTTNTDHTAHSAAYPQSTAFTTSVGTSDPRWRLGGCECIAHCGILER